MKRPITVPTPRTFRRSASTLSPVTRARLFVYGLENPKNVGAAEYSMLHELLTDVGLNVEEDDDQALVLLDTVLCEVIGRAKTLRARLKESADL